MSDDQETFEMRWLSLLCGMSVVTGVCLVIARPFIPFEGMILIGVGLVLPLQFVSLRWLAKKLARKNLPD